MVKRPPDYSGKWIVERDGRVLAHSLHRRSVITWLRLHPHRGAEVRRIPDPNERLHQ